MTTRRAAVPLPPAGGLDVVAGRALRLPRLRGWLLFTIAVVVAFFVLIGSRTALDRSAFELKELETRIAAEEQRYWELRLEVARLEAPDRVMARAAELGLVYPAEVRRTTAVREGPAGGNVEQRWGELKSLLNSQP